MSYCRCGENSDVYLYANICGGWSLSIGYNTKLPRAGKGYRTATLEETMELMTTLKNEGYKIPPYPFERLRKELNGK